MTWTPGFRHDGPEDGRWQPFSPWWLLTDGSGTCQRLPRGCRPPPHPWARPRHPGFRHHIPEIAVSIVDLGV
jgi:hypothetical protein